MRTEKQKKLALYLIAQAKFEHGLIILKKAVFAFQLKLSYQQHVPEI
jgi:hypothetical protein